MNQDLPSKKCFFQLDLYKIEAMIAKFWLHDHIYNKIWFTVLNFVYDAVDRNYDAITVISKYLYFNIAVQSFMIVGYMYQVLGPPSVSSPEKDHLE